MKHGFSIASAIVLAAAVPGPVRAFETEPVQKPGVKLRFVTEENALVPGKPVTIGLFMEHEEEYHTYWKSPGIVGVATRLEWKLPEGFRADPIQWPAPQRTKMAQVTAYGYETDTCLLSTIHVPASVEGDTVTFRVRIGLMCCAVSCHPSWHDFEFELPVSRDGTSPAKDEKWARVFAESRARFPVKAPSSWNFSARNLGAPAGKGIPDLEVKLALPGSVALPSGFDWSEIYFFCLDNQVNSDAPQEVTGSGHSCSIRLRGTDFGPENPATIGGVLFHPKGWPGLDTKWIEVSTPWAAGPES